MKKILPLLILTALFAVEGFGETAQMRSSSTPKTIPMIQKDSPPAIPTSPSPFSPESTGRTTPLYNPTGKADPFLPSAVVNEATEKKKKEVLPLEKFEVGDFVLVGVVTGSGIRKAMVQDLTGKGFFIQEGTRIGKTGGTVIRITDKEVHVKEPFRDFLGRKSSRVIILKLPQTSL